MSTQPHDHHLEAPLEDALEQEAEAFETEELPAPEPLGGRQADPADVLDQQTEVPLDDPEETSG